MNASIRVETHTFAKLAGDWTALAEGAGLLGPFTGYGWQYEWWRALGGGRELRVCVADRDGDTTGILPLFEERQDGARRLALVGTAGGGADHLDAPVRTDDDADRLVRVACALGADLLELDDLDPKGRLRNAALRHATRSGITPVVERRYPCPFIPIRSDWATFHARLLRRENLRRREKWLVAQPGFRVECETSPDAVAPFLERFRRLHAARWREDGGSQAFADARLWGFHERICARLADERRLRLWTMWVAGEAVAVAYTFDDGTRSLYYQSGFHPGWGARSVGLVLFARYVKDAFDRGCTEVDLLRGAEPYKFEWTREGRYTESVRLPLTAIGRAALMWRSVRAEARGAVSSAIPDPVRHRLTRVVREARMAVG